MLLISPLHTSYTYYILKNTPTTAIYTLSLHDALPICRRKRASKITCRRSDVMSKGKKRSGARPGRFLPLDITSLRSEERFSRNAETELVCRLLLEKKKWRNYE